jgi:sec-independent protein translocase protein TatA
MFNQIGLPEILVVLGIALLIFGPKRLPELGRSLGRGMREFRQSISGENKEEKQSTGELGSGEETASQADSGQAEARKAEVAREPKA